MDISQITDIKELKAMGYDQIAIKEQAERNLAEVNKQITKLMNAVPAPDDTKQPTTTEEETKAE